MSPEIERIFVAVADLHPDARAAYYEANGVPAEVRSEVDSLLAFDRGATKFISHGLLTSIQQKMHEDDMAARYGPYRVVKPIGSGGMGTVYLAERVDGEVTQRVAIKLLRNGSRNPERILRFLRERQILATLNHPNIARLIDAGHREDGQPYLAMDYVDGRPVDEYAAGLSIRAKVELVLEICGAISYAHRNLVIHRDLKPSNILVDSTGHVSVLDFGIAKILDDASGDTTTGQRMLTPDYSSPEQVNDRPVTTATDVYSLGGVLYKLLTGTGPHHFAGSTPEGILTAIQNREPVRPSKLAAELRGDLDLILTKALRKDPEERYHTVDELASDLRAYLESRPISGRGGDWAYRSRKFLTRYWVPVTAGTIAIVALIAGFLIANRERAVAQRRFQEVRQLSNKLFDIDNAVDSLPGSTKARQLIVETALDYLGRLSKDAYGDPDLAMDLGNAYLQVAQVQGVASGRNLGQPELADRSLRAAEALLESTLQSQPGNREAILLLANVTCDRMTLAAQKGGRRDGARRPDSVAFAKKCAVLLDRFHTTSSDPHDSIANTLSRYRNIADQLLQCNQVEEAQRILNHAMELAGSLNQPLETGMLNWVAAEAYQQSGDLAKAVNAMERSVELVEANIQKGTPASLAHVLIWQGRILGGDGGINAGRPNDAVKPLARAFQIVDGFVHADPKDQSNRSRLAMAGVAQAGILRHSDPAAALEIYDHTIRHLNEIQNNASLLRSQVDALAGSSYPLRTLRRDPEARKRLNQAFEILKAQKLYPAKTVIPGSVTYKALRARADFEGATGNPAGALEIYRSLIVQMRAASMDETNLLEDAVDLSNVYGAIAGLWVRQGELVRAREVIAQQAELWNAWRLKLPDSVFIQQQAHAAKTVK